MLFWFIFSLLVSFMLLAGVYILWPKIGLMDKPEKYGYKREPVPHSAGIIFYVLFVCVLGMFFLKEPSLVDSRLLLVFAGGTIITLMSFLDDRYDLSPFIRLFLQAVVVAGVVLGGTQVYGFSIPFYGWIELGVTGGQIATWMWIMLLINVINWLDGKPGLSSSVSGVGFLSLFLLAVLPQFHTIPQEGMSILSLSFAVACVLFTLWNVPKLRMLMGDTGSMFLGYMLGVLSVYAGGKIATAALVLAMPVFDAFWVIVRRLWNGKKPWQGDRKHMHHRLDRVGISDNRLLVVYTSFSVVIAGLSLWALSSDIKGILMVLIAVVLFVAAGCIVYLESKVRQKRSGKKNKKRRQQRKK